MDCDLWQKLDHIWQPAQFSAWTKRKLQNSSQSQMWSKWWCWALFGVYCPSDPLQPSNTIETIASEKCAQKINEMHWKLHLLQPALVNRLGPVCLHNSQSHVACQTLQKVNELDYQKVLPHPSYSPDLLQTTTSSRFLHVKKMFSQPMGCRKCLRISQILIHGFLHYKTKNSNKKNPSYFSLAKMYWLQWFLFQLMKTCEPSYNDLTFRSENTVSFSQAYYLVTLIVSSE